MQAECQIESKIKIIKSIGIMRDLKKLKSKMKSTDDFFDIIDEHMEHIQWFYNKFKNKMPVMELSLPSFKIYRAVQLEK